MEKAKLHMCVYLTFYGEDRARRFNECVLEDPHFIGFNYYGTYYRVFYEFDEDEDYLGYYETLKLKLTMGAKKAASVSILSLVKSRSNLNISFALHYSEYGEFHCMFPGTEDYHTPTN